MRLIMSLRLTAQMSPPFNAHDQFVIMKPDEIINRLMQMMGKGRSKGDGHSLAQKITADWNRVHHSGLHV